jgi:hypothetical protein
MLFLDFLLNVNPLAQQMNAPYAPIARRRMPLAGAIVIDLALGIGSPASTSCCALHFPGNKRLWRASHSPSWCGSFAFSWARFRNGSCSSCLHQL